jgi:hypothetical protein
VNTLSSNIFGTKWDEVTGGRPKLDNEALDIGMIISKTMRRAEYKHTRAAYKRIIQTSNEKTRGRHNSENNIKKDMK